MEKHGRGPVGTGDRPVVVDLPGQGSSRPVGAWIMVAVAAAVALGAVVLGARASRPGAPRVDDQAFALMLLGLATVFGGLGLGSLLAGRPGRLVVRVGNGGGLVFPASSVQRLSYWPFAVVLTLAGPMLWQVHRTPGADVSLLQQMLLAMGAVCGPVLAVQLVRARPSELVLRRDAISARGAFQGERVLGWQDLPALAPGPRPLGAMLAHQGREYPERTLASDPRLVAAVLEHYRTHPADRAELGNGRAVERLRRGDV